MDQIAITTPKRTVVVVDREAPGKPATATMDRGGESYAGTLSGPAKLRQPRDGATWWIGFGGVTVGLAGGEAEKLRLWLSARPERTAADVAYDSVRRAEAAADAAESASYYDPARICRARKAADDALDAWRAAHPEAAAARDAEARKDEVARLRRLAAGALVYDADGALDAAAQQARHDELIAQAAALEAA